MKDTLSSAGANEDILENNSITFEKALDKFEAIKNSL